MFVRVLGHIVAAITMFACGAAQAAEYRIGGGDTIEISIVGLPELRQRATVSTEGSVSLPVFGDISVAGLTLSEAQARIRQILPAKTFQQRGAGGLSNTIVIAADEIAVSIVEYRPVYVDGDVAKPGEQPYRVGLTVRQAVAVAGGIQLARLRSSGVSSIDPRSERELALTELSKEAANVARIQAELQGSDKLALTSDDAQYLPKGLMEEALREAASQLAARKSNTRKERNFLESRVVQLKEQLSALRDELKIAAESQAFETQEFQRVQELGKQGTVPVNRVAEVRRVAIQSQDRVLQVKAQIRQVEKEHAEAINALDRPSDERRLELLEQLGPAKLKVRSIQNRIKNLEFKAPIDALASSAVAALGPIQVLVVRKGIKSVSKITADYDTELLPGDAIEIAVDLSRYDMPKVMSER